jgi:hypothetical protein
MPHEVSTRTPTSDRGGHNLDANCTSGLSPPPEDIEADINKLIDELASFTADLFIEGKLNPTTDTDSKSAA